MGSLGNILQKIQETVTNMNQEVSKGSDFDTEYSSLYIWSCHIFALKKLSKAIMIFILDYKILYWLCLLGQRAPTCG